MERMGKVKARWLKSFFIDSDLELDLNVYNCDICRKQFSSQENLNLHNQVHVIERRYRCEPCQVSFHSLGHLQKHNRSSAHEARSLMTQEFGLPTSDNPRPYGCPECSTAFRKHGHLAKHLRSKSHITRLESRGIIPSGTYAALERSGQDLRDKMITTSYEQSLMSLREIAMHLLRTPISSSLEDQVQSPRLQQQVQSPPPFYGSSYSGSGNSNSTSGGGSSGFGVIDNPNDMVMEHFPSPSAQQQPILSPGYYPSSSVSPAQQQQPSPLMATPTNISAGLPAAAFMPHPSQFLHNQSINPIQNGAIFQHPRHQPIITTRPFVYQTELPSSARMPAAGNLSSHDQNMMSPHQESARPVIYIARRPQN